MKIFLSWSGDTSRMVAEYFRDAIKTLFPAINCIFSREIQKGKRWNDEISKELESCDYGIVFLTHSNYERPWLYYEAGALSKSIESGRVIPLLIDLPLDSIRNGPLNGFQATYFAKEDILNLCKDINKNMPEDNRIEGTRLEKSYNDFIWKSLNESVAALLGKRRHMDGLIELRKKLDVTLLSLTENANIANNQYFRRIIEENIEDHIAALRISLKEDPSINVPFVLYPEYLNRLLTLYNVTVKAIAIVDKEEEFWTQRTGDMIYKNTTKESTRLFVFQSRAHMKKHIALLEKHSKKYNIGMMSYDHMVRKFPDYCCDFSIIGNPSTRILAKYNDSAFIKTIEFITNREMVSEHEDNLNEIIDNSVIFPNEYNDEIANEDELIEKVFSQRLKIYNRKQIEMSSYIQVDDYDEHEEEHAYYVEMMEKMLSICKENRNASDRNQRISILELGAGTGIFTKRLAKVENSEIVAVEIDWACYHRLRKNCVRNKLWQINPAIQILNKDSRTYDPPGSFNYIFSSFADHHIKPYDKREYFRNVKRNLKEDGLFLVGDEFLPKYDRDDVESRRNSLRLFHNHIMDIAKRNNNTTLVELEEIALKSGLDENGDFKLSCEEYEELLRKEGLNYEKIKIGPKDRDDIGGVYVYAITKG